MSKNIKVNLNEREIEFIKRLAKRDGITPQKEMEQMFYTELENQMNLYEDELNNEK